MLAAPKIDRGPKQGSRWRQANWRFLEKIVDNLPGRRSFSILVPDMAISAWCLRNDKVVALDVYPYEEVDIVCDMQKAVPFKQASFDAIVLMNVLEHIQQPERTNEDTCGVASPGWFAGHRRAISD